MKYNFFIFLIIVTELICVSMIISPFLNIYPDKIFPFVGFSMFPLSGIIFYYMVNKFYEHNLDLINKKDDPSTLKIHISKMKSDDFYSIMIYIGMIRCDRIFIKKKYFY